MNYNVYSHSPPMPLDRQAYHLNMAQEKQQELLRLNERYEKQHEKYSKALTWLNARSSGLSVASGISNVATLSTFIGLPVNIPLGAISLAGANVSGVHTMICCRGFVIWDDRRRICVDGHTLPGIDLAELLEYTVFHIMKTSQNLGV